MKDRVAEHKGLIQILFSMFFSVLLWHGHCQSIAPGPNSEGLVRAGNVPVNLYTGVPAINVPITSLPHSNGSSIPVALSYHAGGIRVQDISGPVGLGWQLVAGGMITRQVRGIPDTETNFQTYGETPQSVQQALNSIANGLGDGERDVFYFSFPSGSGRFFMNDDNSEAYLMPHQDIDIEKVGTLDNGSWLITDALGNKYYFGETANDRETISTKTMNGGVYNLAPPLTYTSSWFLSRIDFVDSPYDVTFTYQAYSSYTYELFTDVAYVDISGPNEMVTQEDKFTEMTINDPKYLTEISSRLGTVSLDWIADRQDITGGARINTVSVLDHLNNPVESFELETSYFDASDANWSGVRASSDPNVALLDRLKLEGIHRVANGAKQLYYQFDYFNDKFFEMAFEEVDIYELPPRACKNIDHWGFFNGSFNYATRYTPIVCLESDQFGCQTTINLLGSNKSQSSTSVKANMLYSVTGANGGVTEFDFEPNPGGGVRIKRILEKESPDDTNPLITNYSYEEPATFNEPSYHVPIGADNYQILGSSHTIINDFHGSSVGYGKVTVSRAGNGKTITYFRTNNDTQSQDVPPTKYWWDPVVSAGLTTGITSDSPPFTPGSSVYWERGLTDRVEIRDDNNNLIRSIDYDYLEEEPNIVELSCIGAFPGPGIPSIFYVGEYDMISRPIMLEKEIVTLYGEQGLSMSTETTYAYGSTYTTSLPISTETLLPDGAKTRSEIAYLDGNDYLVNHVYDADELGAYLELLNRKAYGTLIDTREYYQPPGGTLEVVRIAANSFKVENNAVYPYQTRNLPLSQPEPLSSALFDELEVLQTRDFDVHGNLLAESGQDGIQTDYTWNDNRYLTSSTTNGRTGSYENNPLIGLQSVTDANGKVVQYEYDNFNRLRLIRDHNNEIVERYRYQFASEGDFSNADLVVTGEFNTCLHLDFEAQGAGTGSGTDKYVWDFGDGTVLETATNIADYGYSADGTYEVSVTRLSDEYDPLHLTETVVIAGMGQDPNIDVCIGALDDSSGDLLSRLCYVKPALGDPGETLSFFATVTGEFEGAGDNLNYTWQYSIDGGAVSDFQNVNGASASSPGQWDWQTVSSTVTVYLTVSTSCGGQASATTPITIDVGSSCTGYSYETVVNCN